jgi:DNA-binding SARP family transcriptional activator/Tfp pilus assembly protein PilF
MLETERIIRIQLFGRPQLTNDEVPLKFKAPPRALSLLAYLLVHDGAPLGRDAVAFALWPDDIEADARANLRRHLFYLSNDVLPPPAAKAPWIVADKRTVSWNSAAPTWCDVREFERLGDDPANAARAVALYRGDLLDGFEDEWLQAPRERLREQQVRLLLGLIESNRRAGAYAAGIDYARALLAVDPWREDGIRALIELRNASGDRAGALATYRDFVKRLEAEMGVEPMAETTAVYEHVASSTGPAAARSRIDDSGVGDGDESGSGDAAAVPFAPSPFWRAPQSMSNAEAVRPVPNFTGRERELTLLDAALWERTGRAAISGLGGMGKSALAREYARRNQGRYAVVWWLNAESEAGIIDGLVRLGSQFVPALAKIDDRRSAAEQVVANVLSELTKTVLLVFDNLDDERLARAWSPRADAHILITSRNAALGGDIVPIRLPPFSAVETTHYLRREIGRTDLTDADALLLAQTLGFLPLALAHAGAYLRGTPNVSAGRYIERINDHLTRTPRGADYDRAVSATFREAIARAEAEAPGAAALLCLAACYAPDALPAELFEQAAAAYAALVPVILEAGAAGRDLRSAVDDPLGVEDALGVLHRLSLLTFSLEARTYTLHRLVQSAARAALGPAAGAWYESAAAVAQAAFPECDLRHWPRCERLAPHARAVLDALPRDAAFAPAARLALRCGRYLHKRAAYADAESVLRRGLAIAEAGNALAPNSELGDHLAAVAARRRDTSRGAEAEPLLRRSIELLEQHCGAEHPAVAAVLNDFAILLHYANRVTEAETHYRRALAIDEHASGANAPVVALRLHNLALALHETNGTAEAEPLLRRALSIDRGAYGPDHPDVASDLGSLGWLLLDSGRIIEAEPLLQRTIDIRAAAFGDAHPSFAHALADVAVLLHDAGRFAEAERLCGQALAIYEASYGAQHPVVAACLNTVAELLADAGRLDQAKAIYRRALASDEATYGPHHPNVGRDLNNYAGLLVRAGRAAEAEPLLARALACVTASYAPDHPRVTAVRANSALLAQPRTASGGSQRWRIIRRSPSRGLR